MQLWTYSVCKHIASIKSILYVRIFSFMRFSLTYLLFLSESGSVHPFSKHVHFLHFQCQLFWVNHECIGFQHSVPINVNICLWDRMKKSLYRQCNWAFRTDSSYSWHKSTAKLNFINFNRQQIFGFDPFQRNIKSTVSTSEKWIFLNWRHTERKKLIGKQTYCKWNWPKSQELIERHDICCLPCIWKGQSL